MRIHCLLRKQKCRLKSTTTNGWRHFGQSERRKSSALFHIQSEKSPDSGFFTCDPTNKCIMPSSRERHKGIIGRGHDLRLRGGGITSTTKNCLFKCKNPTEHNRNMSYRGLFIPESLHLTGFFKGSQMLQLKLIVNTGAIMVVDLRKLYLLFLAF